MRAGESLVCGPGGVARTVDHPALRQRVDLKIRAQERTGAGGDAIPHGQNQGKPREGTNQFGIFLAHLPTD